MADTDVRDLACDDLLLVSPWPSRMTGEDQTAEPADVTSSTARQKKYIHEPLVFVVCEKWRHRQHVNGQQKIIFEVRRNIHNIHMG